MATVTLSDVRKAYDGTEVLRGVSADVAEGEFVVLVGPSGCGKSTLLRMVAGLDPVTSGTVAIDGAVVNDVPPKDRDIAMVFQGYALYPHMTVAENMGFSLRLHGAGRAEVTRRVAEVAEALGLAALLDRYPRALSGGQRQRVAMGRAIVRRPRLFLFDEPLSNLDAKLRVQMRAELREMHERLRVTSLYVTHDQVEAMTLADRVVVLRDGVVEQAGAPLDLFDRPANTFVAGFIGSPAMNLLAGVAEAGGVRLGDGTLLAGLGGRGAVTLGVRPEDLDVLPADADGIPARARTVEPTGSETTLVALMADGTAVTALARERLALRPGDALRLKPRGARVHRFDAAGLRLSP